MEAVSDVLSSSSSLLQDEQIESLTAFAESYAWGRGKLGSDSLDLMLSSYDDSGVNRISILM